MEDWINECTQRLREGETAQDDWKYGLKLDHFIINKETQKPVAYEGEQGLLQMLENLQYKAQDTIEEDGKLIGLIFDGYALTLQAGGQLEIAAEPAGGIFEVRQRYTDARRLLNRELEAMDAQAVTQGYLPAGTAADACLLPTVCCQALAASYEQEGLQDEGRRLLGGTASLKIVLNYDDELDFVQKIRLAYVVAPLVQLMSCNSPVFEGEENRDIFLHRTLCAAADPLRTGMIPGVFDRTFGYRAYAEYICSLPAYYKEERETFPYVRARDGQIEICYIDSMDITEALGVLAFYKGLTTSKTTVGDVLGMITDDEEIILEACERIKEKGFYAVVYSRALRTWIDVLFEKAHGYLPFEELPILLSFEKPARDRRSVCKEMKLPDSGEVSAYYGGGRMIEFMQKGNEMRMAPKEIPEKE